jgi:hypothetical protein
MSESICGWRYFSGAVGSGVEIMDQAGVWSVDSTGPYTDECVAEMRQLGVREYPSRVYEGD